MTDTDPLTDAAVDAARSTLPIYVVADSPDGKVLSNRGGYPDDDTPVWLAGKGGPAEARPMADLYAEYGDDLVAYAEPEEINVAAALHAAGTVTRGQVAAEMGLSEADDLAIRKAAWESGAIDPAAFMDNLNLLPAALRDQALADLRAEGIDPLAYAVTAAQDAPERTADGEVVINPDAPPDPKLALPEDVQEALNAIPGPRSDAEARGDDAAVAAYDRYAEALRSGKTPAEARKVGWPDGDTPAAVTAAVDDQRAVTAALGNAAMDTIEAFLDEAEEMIAGAVVAALGPHEGPLTPLPAATQRMAVGENPDAQDDVIEAFEANYMPDVNRFVATVLGPRPPDGTPDHDADAWDALAKEARLWHARRVAEAATAVTAAPSGPLSSKQQQQRRDAARKSADARRGKGKPKLPNKQQMRQMTPAERRAAVRRWATAQTSRVARYKRQRDAGFIEDERDFTGLLGDQKIRFDDPPDLGGSHYHTRAHHEWSPSERRYLNTHPEAWKKLGWEHNAIDTNPRKTARTDGRGQKVLDRLAKLRQRDGMSVDPDRYGKKRGKSQPTVLALNAIKAAKKQRRRPVHAALDDDADPVGEYDTEFFDALDDATDAELDTLEALLS